NKLTSHGVLRNLYRSRDGRWFVISAVGPVPIRRVLVAIGAEEHQRRIDEGVMTGDPSQVTPFLDDCDEHIQRWAAQLDWAEIAERLSRADATYQQVYAADDIVADPHILAREDIIEVPDEDLGTIRMQGVVPKFGNRAHTVRRAGPRRGADNAEVFGDLLGRDEKARKRLPDDGII